MKKIFLLIPILLLFTSCLIDQDNSRLNQEGKEVEIRFSTGVNTRAAILNEDTIKTVDILIFDGKNLNTDDAVFQYSHYAWKKNGTDKTYTTVLKIGDELDLYFAINAHDYIKDLEFTGKRWSEVYEMLLMGNSPKEIRLTMRGGAGLPMWGYAQNIDIKDRPSYTLNGPIQLLRSVASVDVELINAASSQFTLQKGYIAYAADKGLLAFDPSKISESFKAKEAGVPQDMNSNLLLEYDPTSTGKIENLIYLYENDAPFEETRRSTKLILEGIYNTGGSSAVTYYPLSLREFDESSELVKSQVRRNMKFHIKVNSVNGDGYGSLEEAKEGEDFNMDYNVIIWDAPLDSIKYIDGSHSITIGPDRNEGRKDQLAVLYHNAGSTDLIGFTTDENFPEITMTLTSGDFPDPNQKTVIENDRFRVELIRTNKKEGYFLFTARQAYQEGATNDHKAILKVKTNRIEFNFSILQHDGSKEDWINGGNIDTSLEK